MSKARKKKPTKKPGYMKLHGFQYINDIIRKSPKLLSEAATIVVQFDALDEKTLSLGEILKGKEEIKKIAEKAPSIRTTLEELKTDFETLVATPGKKEEEHFADLVGRAAEFISMITEDVIAPMAEIAEIVEKRINQKETVNV
ncbi:hypothetical protein MOA67_gp189 [Klebsiella phage KpLz-2_45]|uniref:hypothetical protein n=1 Tax=Klebsiella phage KpLz-2_45 TaxID=2698923 RepID=UPI001F13E58B|nr:hypothetical protein MOA67_gp189 [Klebsiella phage KpLz-2_45]UKS72055.1 hypothetical protein KpLz245_1890 [Klebsiella phage KpLz-2_45]